MIGRFLADADLKLAIVSGVMRRRSDVDFKRAEQIPLEGLSDTAVLKAAADERRVLVSHDVSTMPTYFSQFVRQNYSPGLILIPQALAIADAIESLLVICEACQQRDLQNRVCLIPSFATYGF